MLLRRVLSLSVLALTAVLMISTAPLLFIIAFCLSTLPRYRSLPHALAFALGFVFYECIGVLRLGWAWLLDQRRRRSDRSCAENEALYRAHNQAIQYWWAGSLLRMGVRIYALDIQISGTDAINGPAALVIARHTSIADTVLPMLYFAEARHEGLRYILKQELTVMPCLDIAGHRLPNLFVDRSGIDTPGELEAVKTLTREAGDNESVLIYPEGTRYTPAKQQRLRERRPELAEQIERWPMLLPPRLGGVSAMLQANPGKDVVFLAHTGFEGSASLTDLINGSWRHQQIRLHFWRVPYADIPDDHKAFIFRHWDEMQKRVQAMT